MYSGGVMPGRRAGSGVSKYSMYKPKQGSKRFNSIKKTIHFSPLVILIIYAYMPLTGVGTQNRQKLEVSDSIKKNFFGGRFLIFRVLVSFLATASLILKKKRKCKSVCTHLFTGYRRNVVEGRGRGTAW